MIIVKGKRHPIVEIPSRQLPDTVFKISMRRGAVGEVERLEQRRLNQIARKDLVEDALYFPIL